MAAMRDTARITPDQAVDGAKRRRSPQPQQGRSSRVTTSQVPPAAWAEILQARREGERVRVVNATEVWLIPAGRRA
jgi:hypothetical protein